MQALWIGLGVVSVGLLGARHALHLGLAPKASTEGVQPADLGLEAQAVRIATRGGLHLFAWYLSPPALAPQPAPGAVLLHGWGGNASTLLPAAQALNRAGFGVLLPESRNHGRSDRGGHARCPFSPTTWTPRSTGWANKLVQKSPTAPIGVGGLHPVGWRLFRMRWE